MTNQELAEQFDDLLWGKPKFAYQYRGDNYLRCATCDYVFNFGEIVFYSKHEYRNYLCQKCSERKTMPNIKITAEVDGKQVPLKTVSTETFEAIKALEKPKEIPVARIAEHIFAPKESLRLLITLTQRITLAPGRVYSFDTESGKLVAEWETRNDNSAIRTTYKNIRPL